MRRQDFLKRSDEQLLTGTLANQVQGQRAYGGHLYVTTQRMVFVPMAAGGRWSEIAHADIAGVDVARRGRTVSDASWRRRLRVRTLDGGEVFFVVWRPRKLSRLLQQLRC